MLFFHICDPGRRPYSIDTIVMAAVLTIIIVEYGVNLMSFLLEIMVMRLRNSVKLGLGSTG